MIVTLNAPAGSRSGGLLFPHRGRYQPGDRIRITLAKRSRVHVFWPSGQDGGVKAALASQAGWGRSVEPPSLEGEWVKWFSCAGTSSVDRLLFPIETLLAMFQAASRVRICPHGSTTGCATSKAGCAAPRTAAATRSCLRD